MTDLVERERVSLFRYFAYCPHCSQPPRSPQLLFKSYPSAVGKAVGALFLVSAFDGAFDPRHCPTLQPHQRGFAVSKCDSVLAA